MKRIFVILLVLCLVLVCGCKAKPEETTPTTEVVEATVETTEPETEPAPVYTHPLTGEVLEAPYTGRPAAVVINNLKACLPQYGISDADMIYEVETEGGITRFLAIFSDFTKVDKIGPVRSLRTFFTNLATSYSIPAIHCGGSGKALAGMHDISTKLSNWEHIDQVYNGNYFYRDQARRSQGYALEHTLFSTGEKLNQAMKDKGYDKITEGGVSYGLQFAENVSLDGEAANKITITFKGKKVSTFELNAEGLYEASQYNKKHVDGGNKKTMSYRNVLAIVTTQKKEFDGKYSRSFYDLVGSGDGYFACGGKIIPIKWTRATVNDPFSYTTADGKPVTLGVGKTYTAVIANSSPAGVAYQ